MLFAVASGLFFAAPLLSFPIPNAMFSRLLGERLPAQIQVEGVRWKPFFGQRFFITKLSFSSGMLRSLPGLGTDFGAEGEALLFRDAAFGSGSSASDRRLHILKMRSLLVEFRGGVCWERGRIEKASIAAFLPSSWVDRLPDHWGRRLSPAASGQKILKCAYKNHQLTFYGRSGPLLRAAWSPD